MSEIENKHIFESNTTGLSQIHITVCNEFLSCTVGTYFLLSLFLISYMILSNFIRDKVNEYFLYINTRVRTDKVTLEVYQFVESLFMWQYEWYTSLGAWVYSPILSAIIFAPYTEELWRLDPALIAMMAMGEYIPKILSISVRAFDFNSSLCLLSLFFHAMCHLNAYLTAGEANADQWRLIRTCLHCIWNCYVLFFTENNILALGSTVNNLMWQSEALPSRGVRSFLCPKSSVEAKRLNDAVRKKKHAKNLQELKSRMECLRIVGGTTLKGASVARKNFVISQREKKECENALIVKSRQLSVVHNLGKRSWLTKYTTPCLNLTRDGAISGLNIEKESVSMSLRKVDTHISSEYFTEMFSSLLPSVTHKLDDTQFETMSAIAGKLSTGIKLQVTPNFGGDQFVETVSKSFNSLTTSIDTNGLLSALDVTADLPGLCKAVLYLYTLSVARKKFDSTSGNILCLIASSGVLYRIFTQPDIHMALDKLTNILVARSVNNDTVSTESNSGVLDAINACFLAYFTSNVMHSSSIGDIAMNLSKAKNSMTGVSFGLKTLGEYLTYILNFFLGCDDALVAGDPSLQTIVERIASTSVLLRAEGSVFKGLQILSECKAKLTEYRIEILRNTDTVNKGPLLTVIKELLDKIENLASKYDNSVADGTASYRMLAISIAGPSRIGKSMFITDAAQAMVLHLNKNNKENFAKILENPEMFIKVLKNDAKYLDLTDNPEVLVVDDLDVTRVTPGGETSELRGLLFQCGSSRKPEVDGAFVKGYKVGAKILIAATNVAGEVAKQIGQTVYNHPEAQYNRMNPGTYVALLKKEFAISTESADRWTWKLDNSKLRAHDGDFPHLEFLKMDMFSKKTSGPSMTASQFITHLTELIDERKLEHHTRARGYYDSMVKRMKAIDPSFEPEPFKNPDEMIQALRDRYNVNEAAAQELKKGWLASKMGAIEDYVPLYFTKMYDGLNLDIKNILQTCAKMVYGYRKEIIGAIALIGGYQVLSVIGDMLFSCNETESGKPKILEKRLKRIPANFGKALKAPEIVVQAGTVDTTTIDVMNKVLKNVFKMCVNVEGMGGVVTKVPLAFGLQSGKHIFMPRHYLTKVDSLFNMDPLSTVELMFDSGKSYKLSKSDFDDSRLFVGTAGSGDDDFMSIYLESAPPKADLTGKFMTADELTRLFAKGTITVAFGETSYVHDTTMTYRVISTVKGAISAKQIISYNADDVSEDRESFTIARTLCTESVVTSDGLCGSLYFVDGKIIAMHVAASKNSSIGLIVSQFDVSTHVAWHELRGKVNVSELEPTLGPVPSGVFCEAQLTHVMGTIDCSIPRRNACTGISPFHNVGLNPDLGLKGKYEVMNLSLTNQHACLEGRPNVLEAVNMDRLDRVLCEKKRLLSSAVSVSMVNRNMHKLTLEEAINGVDDISGMNRGTSMGFMSSSHDKFDLPKGITKVQYLGMALDYKLSTYNSHCHNSVTKVLSYLRQGVINYDACPELYVVALPKDESRKVGKSTRMVYCYTPVLNAIIVMYFARSVALYKSLGLSSNIAYINPFSQANEMLTHLTSCDQVGEVMGIDLDFAAWDVTLHPVFFSASLRHIVSYACYTGEDLVVVETLINIIARPSVVVALNSNKGVVMKMNAGLASGSPLTSVGNSVANDLLVAYGVTCGEHHLLPMQECSEQLMSEINVVTHGDDMVAVPSKFLLESGFNYTRIATVMTGVGMRPQPISKDGKVVELRHLVSRSVDDTASLEFLCRNFVKVDNVIKLANKNETNVKQLLFEGKEFASLSKQDKETRWNEFFVEISQRGRKYYEKYKLNMTPILLQQGLSPSCSYSYDRCITDKDQVTGAMMWI